MKAVADDYDVVVAGAGPAGAVAALQAARAGARVLLVELGGAPGGATTLSGVNYPGLFHAWGKQVVGGIGWELVRQAVAETGDSLPDFSRHDLPHWRLQVQVNPHLYACLLDEAFAKSGVEVLYHAMPLAATETADDIRLVIATKEGPKELVCRVAVDCTGDANLAALAGHALRRNQEKQPATPMLWLGGYDPADVNLEEVETAYKGEVAAGRMSHLDTGMALSMAHLVLHHGANCVHVPCPDASTSEGLSDTEQAGRAAALRLHRFLRRFPGLRDLTLERLAPQCGIRETATIVGQTTVTVDDYVSGKSWPDSLCHSFYPVDLHQCGRESGLRCEPLAFGTFPTVPRGALIPTASRRMLAAGRCVSSDQLANSALRVQASCMAMGQAAGALATLAAAGGTIPAALDISQVKTLLRNHGAVVPD